MSPAPQVVLTAVELLALVAALAILLLLVTRRLRSVAGALAEVRTRIPGLDERFGEIASAAADVNRGLEQLAAAPPASTPAAGHSPPRR